MRATYRYLAIAVSALVVFQAAVLAYGTFDIADQVDANGSIDKGTAEDVVGLGLHGIGAMVISLAVIALLVVSFFVQAAGAVRWALIVFGLTVLQWVLAILAFEVGAWIGILHGLNAFAIAATAGLATRTVREAPPVAATAVPV